MNKRTKGERHRGLGTKTGRGAASGGVSIVWVGVFGYLFLCLNVLFFSSLLAAAPSTFEALAKEDDWVESLTAVWFLLAGLVLFVTALVERSFFRRGCRSQIDIKKSS